MSLFKSLGKEIIATLHEAMLPATGAVLALSGGMDSMCLLHLLMGQEGGLPFPLRAVHVDHGIRSRSESQRDLECVQSQCNALGVSLSVCRADLGQIAKWKKETGGIEAGARLFRYRVMYDLLEHNEVLLTAHHLDDLVETMVCTFFEASLNDPFNFGQAKIVRPFLVLDNAPGRKIISQIIKEEHIPYVEDSTNVENQYRRNFMRNKVLPLVGSTFAGLDKRMLRLRDEWADIHEALELCAPESPWQASPFLGKDALRCSIGDVYAIPQYFRIVYCRRALLNCSAMSGSNSSNYRIPTSFILKLLSEARKKDNFRIEGYGCICVREKNWIFFLPSLAIYTKKGYLLAMYAGESCFLYPLSKVLLRITMRKAKYCFSDREKSFYLRPWGEGRRTGSIQMFASVFKKVPLWLRSAVSVLECAGHVCAIIYPDLPSQSWVLAGVNAGVERQFFVEQV